MSDKTGTAIAFFVLLAVSLAFAYAGYSAWSWPVFLSGWFGATALQAPRAMKDE